MVAWMLRSKLKLIKILTQYLRHLRELSANKDTVYRIIDKIYQRKRLITSPNTLNITNYLSVKSETKAYYD